MTSEPQMINPHNRLLRAEASAQALPEMPDDWWPEIVQMRRDRVACFHLHPSGKKWIRLAFVREAENVEQRLLDALRESAWHCCRVPVDDPSIADALGDTP